MLKAFGALPTEERVREMKNRDYLWCLTHMLLDREEELERLCPGCRLRALEERCAVCGRPAGEWGEGADSAAFDWKRFEALKRGDARA